jgi:hypothetical protein
MGQQGRPLVGILGERLVRTDDVYVTYVDNGYYLFDRRYPNVAIAISISM